MNKKKKIELLDSLVGIIPTLKINEENCRKALNDYDYIKDIVLDLPEGLNESQLELDLDCIYGILDSLIDEYFQPQFYLLSQLEEGMVVWDDNCYEIIKIKEIYVDCDGCTCIIPENVDDKREYREKCFYPLRMAELRLNTKGGLKC